MLATQDGEDLGIDDVRGRMIIVLSEPLAIASALGPPISTSQRLEASTTSIRPGSALIVEGCRDLQTSHLGGAPPGAGQPHLHPWAAG
jgi:hypothetical protein